MHRASILSNNETSESFTSWEQDDDKERLKSEQCRDTST